jgi:hypothetical protein
MVDRTGGLLVAPAGFADAALGGAGFSVAGRGVCVRLTHGDVTCGVDKEAGVGPADEDVTGASSAGGLAVVRFFAGVRFFRSFLLMLDPAWPTWRLR